MAKNANFVSHKKSKLKENGGPKLPLASDLVEGEIAINFGKDVETLSIKNESGDVVTFSSDNYYTEKKLGSGFTGENSGVTVTEAIENSEEVSISSGVTPSGTGIEIWIDESVDPAEADVYTKEQTDSLLNLKLDTSAYTEYWTSGTGLNSIVQKGTSGVASGDYAVAEGYQTSATSNYSHAEGGNTLASGVYSHAEGMSTSASADYSHAEGYSTTASGYYSHAEGNCTTASGSNSHAEGGGTTANGNQSHAEGGGTTANGTNSHAEGGGTKSYGDCSHAEGQSTQAIGSQSHAEGGGTQANGAYSHAEGGGTKSYGDYSHAEGQYTTASGYYSHTEGNSTTASGESSHAEGTGTIASGSSSHAEGGGTKAYGTNSHAEGYSTEANGARSHAEGSSTQASGNTSHAEGGSTTASGNYSHAEGGGTKSYGDYSHAEGQGTIAIGDYSHAEGFFTTASGQSSHAEGFFTKASEPYSHAEGYSTEANGARSHAEGQGTIANNQSEHASGQYNVSSSASTTFGNSGNTLFSVGNGTAEDARHNAFEIRQNGDIYIVNKNGQDVKLQDEIGNITIDQTIDSGTSASTNAVSTSAVYGFVTSYTPSITVDQVLDDTTSASTNPVSSKAVYDAVTDNELVWTNAFVALSGAVSSHTEDTTVHVTAADKAAWNAKLDASAIADFFDDAKYEDSGTTKVINFYHRNTIKATIDASDFIVDGMVDDVKIENSYLVIDFNTASGKQDISIPLTDIFDPSNYYDKAAIDNLVGSGFTSSSITEVIIENEEIVSAALTDLDERKLDASAYTPTDLSNYYTKSETSGATEISNALGAKVNSATYTGHTADTTIHFTTGTVQTQIDNSISGKVNTSDIVTAITSSNSGSTNPIATKVVAENELTVSTALNDLNTIITGHTADTNIHLTTTEKGQLHTHTNKTALDSITGNVGTMAYQSTNSYSSATQVNTALAGKSNTGHTHSISEITNLQTTLNGKANTATTLSGYGITNAYTKTEIDNKIGDIETLLAAI